MSSGVFAILSACFHKRRYGMDVKRKPILAHVCKTLSILDTFLVTAYIKKMLSDKFCAKGVDKAVH